MPTWKITADLIKLIFLTLFVAAVLMADQMTFQEGAYKWLQILPGFVLSIINDSGTQWLFVAWLAHIFFHQFFLDIKKLTLFAAVLMAALAASLLSLYIVQYHDVQPMEVPLFFGAIAFAAMLRRWRFGFHDLKIFDVSTLILWIIVFILSASVVWQPGKEGHYYQGPRWCGFWNNPNTFGMLMSAGIILVIGLGLEKIGTKESKNKRLLAGVIIIMAGILLAGLIFSYSRGSWFSCSIGLASLAWMHGKLRFRILLPSLVIVAVVVCIFWKNTPNQVPWYIQRLDFSRPSAQNRITAWRAGFQMIHDHPLGLGWRNAMDSYEKHYAPPKGGPGAIVTNDYLMMGTELGLPVLACFVGYVGLCLGGKKWQLVDDQHQTISLEKTNACRAAVVAFLVGFWLDGGLFHLPTAVVFWVLLELGSSRQVENQRSV